MVCVMHAEEGIPGGIRNRECTTDHDKQGDEQQAIKLQ